MTPLDRLNQVEKLALKLLDAVTTLEGENMGLKERIAALEGKLVEREVPYGTIYDTLREIELCTSPRSPNETRKQWDSRFIEKHGTRKDFITKRTKNKEV